MQKVFMMRSGGLGSSSVDHPTEKTSMQWEKITKLQCQKSVPQWHDFFKKNNKNNTEFLGAETAKKGCSLA